MQQTSKIGKVSPTDDSSSASMSLERDEQRLEKVHLNIHEKGILTKVEAEEYGWIGPTRVSTRHRARAKAEGKAWLHGRHGYRMPGWRLEEKVTAAYTTPLAKEQLEGEGVFGITRDKKKTWREKLQVYDKGAMSASGQESASQNPCTIFLHVATTPPQLTRQPVISLFFSSSSTVPQARSTWWQQDPSNPRFVPHLMHETCMISKLKG